MSETTEPAVDDFESRFYEIEEYFDSCSSDNEYQIPTQLSRDTHKSNATQLAKSKRSSRISRPPPQLDEYVEEKNYNRGTTSSVVRTRLGYQNSQSTLWSLEDVTGGPTEFVATPTPEQLEARQRRIIRRRASAKTKAELEKRMTVEKLLRIRTDFTSGQNNSRGRGRKKIIAQGTTDPLLSGDSEDDNLSNQEAVVRQQKNVIYPSATLDPPAGYIRQISSSRLQLNNVIALPVEMKDLSVLFPPISGQIPKQAPTKICGQCHTQARRYACAKTGVSLCSLECYKLSNMHLNKVL